MDGIIQIEIVRLPGSELHAYIIENTANLTAQEAMNHLEQAIKIIQQGCRVDARINGPEGFEKLSLTSAVAHTIVNINDIKL